MIRYTRGQFTAHVQRNGNERVNDVWRYCKDLSTIDGMTETFFMRKNCMDEVKTYHINPPVIPFLNRDAMLML